jgi:D-alanine-D-alanine ligase
MAEYIKMKDVLHILDLVITDDSIKRTGKAIRKRLKELPTVEVKRGQWEKKPSRLGSSVGASIATNRPQLLRAIDTALSLGGGFAVIEEYLEGARELECAFFELKGKQYFTNIGEIRCKNGFYDYDNKYSSESQASLFTKSDIPDNISDRIHEYSSKLVSSIGCRDLSRVDFFLSKDGKLYFNEINTMPGLTAVSMFPRLVRDFGFSLSELFIGFIDSALERSLW